MDIDKVLTLFPWKYERDGNGNKIEFKQEPIEFCWQYEFDFPLNIVWQVIGDTSLINQRLGLGAMQFKEQAGRVFGTGKIAGLGRVALAMAISELDERMSPLQ